MKNYVYQVMTNQRNDPLAFIFKLLLWLLSIFYWLGISLVNFAYNSGLRKIHHLSKPVISVGNITVGGAGKTPLIIYIAQYLRKEGMRPVILMRGYMLNRSSSGHGENFSDEAEVIKKHSPDIPVLVGANRLKNAQSLSSDISVDIFLLDDGFQHRQIHRQLDIVAVDTTNPFGNGLLLPRGILREPLSSLSRVDFFILTKTDQGQHNVSVISNKLNKIKQAPMAKAVHRPVHLFDLKIHEMVSLSFIKGSAIVSFCSIGEPNAFANTLVSLGAVVKKNFAFLDHHVYQKQDIQRIIDFCQHNQITTLVTTEKDEVKLKEFDNLFPGNIHVFSLRIILDIVEGQETLHAKLMHACQSKGKS